MHTKHKKNPPRVYEFFLSKLIEKCEYESLSGDFSEIYSQIISEKGNLSGHAWYLFHLLRLLPVFIGNAFYWKITMLWNYLKIALRIVRKHLGYSIINVLGLSIGMACSILMLLYVQDEMSYDKYHENADRIYRVALELHAPNEPISNFAVTSPPLAETLVNENPGILQAVRFTKREMLVSFDNNRFYEDGFYFVDDNVFDVFSYKIIQGDPQTMLKEPYTVAITQEIASKYFGSENPVGKTIVIGNTDQYEITGILENIPQNSHFRFDFLASFATILPDVTGTNTNWWDHGYYTYILVDPVTSLETIKENLYNITTRYIAKEEEAIGFKQRHFLQPLTEIYLGPILRSDISGNGSKNYLIIFTTAALFVLLLACINFMNLSTARSANRAKETGLRKVGGAHRKQLTLQFIAESVIFSSFALLLALIILTLTLPAFSEITGKDLSINFISDPQLVLYLLLITLTVGVFSGAYPAFYLSAFKPIDTIRGTFSWL